MKFERLERKSKDDKGNIVVFAGVDRDVVKEILAQFYGVIAKSKGLDASMDWDKMDEVASESMGAIEYKELRRDFVVNRILGDAILELDLKPAITPQIHVLDYPSAEEPFEVEASIVEQPRITLSSLEPVEVVMDGLVVNDRVVAARVAELLDSYATYDEAEPHVVRAGDAVLLDVDTQLDGVLVGRLSGKKMTLELDGESMPAEFYKGVIGMNVGESKTFDFTVARDRAISQDDVEKYTSVVTVLSQLKKNEIELTDDWVRAHYPSVVNVKEFFEEVRKDAEYDALVYNRDTLSHLSNNELEKRMQGDIPDAFYQASYKSLMAKIEADLAKQGKTLDDYYEEEDTNEQEFSVKMLIQSGENLKQGFALEALFDGRGMTLGDEEIEKAAARFFDRELSVDDLRQTGRLRLAESMAKREKALGWLVETAIVRSED